MDEDNTSTTDDQQVVDTPAEDPILDLLSDTEDESTEVEATEKPVEKAKEDAVEETPDEKESEAETPPEGEEPIKEEEEAQPLDPKEENRRRYEERQQLKAEREARILDQTKDYIEGAEDEYDSRLRAMEVQRYSELIENNEGKLVNEFERAKANPDLQIFNPDNKEAFNEKLYDKAMRDYNAGQIEYDQNGNMVGIKGSLFEHLTETAELFNSAVQTGAVQQVRANKNMRSNADVKPAATPKAPVKDDILDILKSD